MGHCSIKNICPYRYSIFIICCILVTSILMGSVAGCSSADAAADSSKSKGTPWDNTPSVLTPQASGVTVIGSDNVSIDISNISDGYLMMQYNGSNEKVKFQIQTPDGTECTYLVDKPGEDAVYPLPGGNGSYTLKLLEVVDLDKNLYAVSFTQTIDVQITDEFSPFLYPNYYVNYTADSKAVKRGLELAEDCYSALDVISNIYNYVIKNISYDDDKAENVSYGYTPDVDETLSAKKGICFDYASLMTAMLRTQRIPTRLEVGYAGEAYHAWISCYVKDVGWVNDIIRFDGKDWSLMDPTFAASHNDTSVKKYIGDGSKYMVKYTY